MITEKCESCKSLNAGTKFCNSCGRVLKARQPEPASVRRMSPYERTRAAVYATGNKWAIENFNAVNGRN